MNHRYKNLERLTLPPQPADAMGHLVRILDALVDIFGAQKIIVFGSCARGTATEHSDVDLCVVRDRRPGCTHPTREASSAAGTAHALLSKDILVRDSSQFEKACREPFGIMEEVVRHGIPVYEG